MGTVAASLILLFALSMLVFYFNRHVLFEQRTAINQTRAMQSHALAQGGLDWAMTRLNDHRALQSACAFSGQARARELVLSTAGVRLHAACLLNDGGTMACSCASNEAVSAWPAHDATALHGFTVQLFRHADDAQAVQITALGCVNAATPCNADDGEHLHARLHLIARAQPLLWRRPVAPLTAGGGIQVCAPASLANADSRTPGWWAHAGSASVSTCAGSSPPTLRGVPGSSVAHHDHDSLLAARAADQDAFFAAWFGTPIAHYRAIACQPQGDTPGVRAGDLRRLFDEGCRRFFVDGDITFDPDSTLGSADDPVALVLTGRAAFSGAAKVHGLIYSDAADAAALQWAQLRWLGAVIVRGNLLINSGVDGSFDDAVLQRLAERAAVMVAVPGSWRDE